MAQFVRQTCVCDAGENVAQTSLRIDAVEFRRFDQRKGGIVGNRFPVVARLCENA